MKYLIKINRNSITNNSNAGNTSTIIPGIIETTFEMSLNVRNKKFIKLSNSFHQAAYHREPFFIYKNYKYNRCGFMIKSPNIKFIKWLCKKIAKYSGEENQDIELSILKRIIKEDKKVWMSRIRYDDKYESMCFEENRNLQTITHAPEKTWLYKYKNTKVQCDECEKKFSHTKLRQDWLNGPILGICPYCEIVNCCDIEYENINEIMGYKNIKEEKI